MSHTFNITFNIPSTYIQHTFNIHAPQAYCILRGSIVQAPSHVEMDHLKQVTLLAMMIALCWSDFFRVLSRKYRSKRTGARCPMMGGLTPGPGWASTVNREPRTLLQRPPL